MIPAFDAWVLRVLRVPPPPQAPAGSSEASRVLKAAPGFFRQRLLVWGWRQAAALAGILFGFAAGNILPKELEMLLGGPIRIVELIALGLFALQLALSFSLVRLDYLWRWYVVTDRSLRIRQGLFKIREQTVSFANIQNVGVRQGPVQRWLGIADLEIRTAGGGQAEGEGTGKKNDFHKAVFRGVADAEGIRDRILHDLRRLRDSGLGDRPDSADGASGELDAARELTSAARALRGALAAQG